MLSARWKGETKALGSQSQPLHVGQVRNFRIATIDRNTKQISLELTG
jgi:small subunit ribosomal protein S1